jgi:hypothetical protein
MSRIKSLRTIKIKWITSIAILIVSVLFFAFKENGKRSSMVNPKDTKTLWFMYQSNDYTAPQVSSQSNWELINSGEACEQDVDEKACSFSIEIASDDEPLFLNGTHPSSRVKIEVAGSGTTYFVSDVKDNAASVPIALSIENIRK